MDNKQPFVFRMFFGSKQEAELAHDQLECIGVFNDMVESEKTDPMPYKVVFTDNNVNLAKVSMRRIQAKSNVVQVFDPNEDVSEGWSSFKTFSLT